ncbi:MAG TPA: NUDIX domain-containing protein [Candidatus Saccharimonadales bacterium]|nr:NUDIX domain-containing protein [Candidatus Saccharimonadales bacterium]
MAKAARAIIIENGKILVMYRNKYGSEYYTLVGGRLADQETPEQALVREVHEETGLQITEARLVFIENHPEPYNDQYIYICKVAPYGETKLQEASEEAMMNRLDANIHKPMWADARTFSRLAFRTPALLKAIVDGLNHGFPEEPKTL